MVIGLQIGKLHRGREPPHSALLDSEKPDLFGVKGRYHCVIKKCETRNGDHMRTSVEESGYGVFSITNECEFNK